LLGGGKKMIFFPTIFTIIEPAVHCIRIGV
jgi:hypothetical protein